MRGCLYIWDKKFGPTGGTLGFDYYYKLSFAGLVKNGTSELLDEAEQLIPTGSSWSEINRIIENEATGNHESKGEKCK